MAKHLALRIEGRVHGVFFRYGAKKKADALGLTGFVRNEPCGTVFIEVEGDEAHLEKFIKWCRVGPKLAKVTTVEMQEGEFQHFQEFRVQ